MSDEFNVHSHHDLTMRQVVYWPLHVIGLDPGRAVANANPSEAQRGRHRRAMCTIERRRKVEPSSPWRCLVVPPVECYT